MLRTRYSSQLPGFIQQIDYYRTCFHELGHWTGAKHRLARDHSGRFGSHPYAREELVAEMTSAFVCAALGITPTVRHTDYLANWLEVLKEDMDVVGLENLDVQLLTRPTWVGHKKARQSALWAEALGFKTTICERPFRADTRVSHGDPRIAIVGVDNLDARRHAAAADFDLLVDAGLGATAVEAFDVRIHSFPGSREPQQAWPEQVQFSSQVGSLPANLEALVSTGRITNCGALTLANKSVGVPCTALSAAAVQLAQVCRTLATGRCADVVDFRLPDLSRQYWNTMPGNLKRIPATTEAGI